MPLAAYADTPRALRLFPSHALQRLVARHSAACVDAGLHLDALHGADDGTVSRWLHARGGMLPAALADDLERIDELADDRGASSLIEAAERLGGDARALGLDPLEVAVRSFLDHPRLFERAHSRRVLETLRGATEFAGRRAGPPRAVDLAAIQAVEVSLGRQFDARSRSRHCQITVGRDGDRHVFTVAHGALVRVDEALDERPMVVSEAPGPVYFSGRAVRYRPQRRDVVVYEEGAGRLRIRAGDAPTLRAYRASFGELLFDDAGWFGDDPIVTLEPLVRLGAAVEMPTPGLREVRLVGLIVRHRDPVGKMALDSDELWPYLRARMVGGLDDAELVEADLRVFPVGASSGAIVKVRAPNRVEYGRIPDDLVRPYLEQRGFLARACGV
jgi:hypothetical protein